MLALVADHAFRVSDKIVNVSLWWLAVAALLSGCGHREGPATESSDVDLRSRLTGTWVTEGRGVTTLKLDGTFSSRWTNTHASPMAIWQYEGIWTVTSGVWVSTITNSKSWETTNRSADGRTDLFRILALDERKLVWESNGQTNSLERKK
jgi:hypothetical protein